MELFELIKQLHEFYHLVDSEKINADCREAYEAGYLRGHSDGRREGQINLLNTFGKDI